MALTWEDKEVRFDIPFSEMRLKSGEKIIDRLDNIEDTKGNGGDRGRLIVTNLRILWHSVTSPRINLSIGYNCMTAINSKLVNSKLRGSTQALYILTQSNNSKFEFIFTNLVPGNMRHFTTVMSVHKAYVSSKLYRELKLRSAVVHKKQIKILPQEQIYRDLHGVWNLSSDQGSLGTLIITNVRIVWFADMNEGFNISLPHLQISTIKILDTKFGLALVITTSNISGALKLGFRIDPEEKLKNVYKELKSVSSVYSNNPIYGVECTWVPPRSDKSEHAPTSFIEDIEEIEEPRSEMSNAIASYLIDKGHSKERPPVYCPDLGLAIEKIKDGFTLRQLWEVIPS